MIGNFFTRPRILYVTYFFWNAVVGGRFLAPFLKKLAVFSNLGGGEGFIGAALAFQLGLEAVLGSWAGSIADALERRKHRQEIGGRSRGRLLLMQLGIILGCAIFLSYSIPIPWIWWQFFLRALFAVARSLTLPVLDGLTVAFLEEESITRGETNGRKGYGQERMYGAIGWGIASVIMGASIDLFGSWSLFGWAVASSIACLISIHIFEQSQVLSQRPAEEQHLIEHQTSSLCRPSHDSGRKALPVQTILKAALASCYSVSFFFAFFTLSIGMSVVENIIFLFYESTLGSSNTMCGLTVAFTVLFELPIFYVSPRLLHMMDAGTMMKLACFCYILRVVGYVLVRKMGVVVLCLDLLHGASYALSQIGCVEYISCIVPEGYEASGQGLLVLFRGSGAVLGLLIGGWVEEKFGPKVLYAGLASIVSIGSVALFSAGHFSTPRRMSLR